MKNLTSLFIKVILTIIGTGINFLIRFDLELVL